MNIHQTYGYLIRARRDLWRTLESVPDDILSRPGSRFQCIKNLVFHIADVEDGWLHYDISAPRPSGRAYPPSRKIHEALPTPPPHSPIFSITSAPSSKVPSHTSPRSTTLN